MKRKLKALGPALLAVLAMGALAATAQAETDAEFTQPEDQYPLVLTGHEEEGTENFWRFTGPQGSKTECATTTYEATAEEDSTELTVTPHYAGCTWAEVGTAIDLNGCDYVFYAGTATESDAHGEFEIACPGEGGSITITIGSLFGSPICEMHIPEQRLGSVNTEEVTYTNKKAGPETDADWVTLDLNVKGITYTETDTQFPNLCPFTQHTFHGNDGELVSSVAIKGYEDTENSSHPSTTGKEQYLHKGTEIDIDVG